MNRFKLLLVLPVMWSCSAQQATPVSDSAFKYVNDRVSEVTQKFFIYEEQDSGFNSGVASGVFGSSAAILQRVGNGLNAGCILDLTQPGGCSSSTAVSDIVNGTML